MAGLDKEPEYHSLIMPCFDGDLELVKRKVGRGADVIRDNCDVTTSFWLACLRGHCEIVKYFIKLGVDVNEINLNGDSAVHHCITNGQLECLKILVDNGARLDVDFRGMTPLLQASEDGKADIVEYLMKLPSCSRAARIEAVELLGATYIDDQDDLENTDYYWLWSLGERARAEPGDNIPPKREETHPAFGAKEFQTDEELLALEFSIDEVWMQSLLIRERIFGPHHSNTITYVTHRAISYAKEGNFERSISLLTYILDIQQKSHGVSVGILKNFCSLIDMFEDVMSEGSPVKYQEVMTVFITTVDILKYKIKPQRMQSWNYTPFNGAIYAVIRSVSLLAELEPSISEDDRLKFRKVLYDFVHLNLRDRTGCTLLHLACLNEMTPYSPLDVVKLLLEVGADPQVVSLSGDTPLHSVATNDHSTQHQIIKLLLSAGIHYDACNAEGYCFTDLLDSDNAFKVDNPMDYCSLKCLSAKAVQKYAIPYESIVPHHLAEFVKLH